MSSRRLAALCGAVVLAGWAAAELAGFGSPRIEKTGAWLEQSRITLAAYAQPVEAPQAAAVGEDAVAVPDMATVDPGLLDPRPTLMPEPPPVQVVSANPDDPVYPTGSASPVDTSDACRTDECIDQYLWSVYQRTPKLDTIKVSEQIKVTIKKKGKARTVTKTTTKVVDEDFTWKDPKAADKAGMPVKDYVIGGMDRGFKLKLYSALRALDEAGLAPGITSGFRDDYRQAIASGKKAATDRSYHGGSLRGGYGHGLAADLVSVKGDTRAERWISSDALWKWVDTHGKEFGVGRPYLDRDPPHVGPIDGQEYVVKRGLAKAKLAQLETSRRHPSAVRDGHSTAKGAKTAKSSKAKSI